MYYTRYHSLGKVYTRCSRFSRFAHRNVYHTNHPQKSKNIPPLRHARHLKRLFFNTRARFPPRMPTDSVDNQRLTVDTLHIDGMRARKHRLERSRFCCAAHLGLPQPHHFTTARGCSRIAVNTFAHKGL